MTARPIAWIIARLDQFKGDQIVCQSMAERLGVEPVFIDVKDIETAGGPKAYVESLRGGRADDVFPDYLISSQPKSTNVSYVLGLKQLSNGKSFAVQLSDPKERRSEFDVVVNPIHNGFLAGTNVIPTLGIANRITPELLAEKARAWEEKLHLLPHPRIAVILGGDSPPQEGTIGGGEWKVEEAKKLGQEMRELASMQGGSLLVTNSPRTSSECWEAFKHEIEGVPIYTHDYSEEGKDGLTYPGLLQAADKIVVTPDSMSMASEACSSGKPVYMAQFDHNNVRSDHHKLGRQLMDMGHARPLIRFMEDWSNPRVRLDETTRIAQEVLKRHGQRVERT